ncbi:Gfo/Idh/MocA family oxidoreductase [Paenibacillus sp. HWE-109]|uniref:Gfo/Idh/MocA family protein n=1 Tax=Paenibacillus sp. HWE-109 TaxID=1306526 RepID=UPI001EDE2AB1|nr:Gfo/Idh/MocA family oxidoreductase [Paenibacillus sp. HWE-109]UKS27125.1 Gfo/Idh/MocA family oxidoreductase [Paenibacillus sp. HWE-109]
MNKLNVAIIGCGGIALGKHLPSLHKIEQVAIVGFYDIERVRAQEAAAKYGAPDAKVYESYAELLADASIEVVHICTPNDSHAEISIAALEAGKHVMCEKPMAKTAADARRMVETAKRTGKKLTIGYNNRFRADSQYLKRVIEDGDLGEIYFAKAHAVRRRGVPTWGVFLDEEKQGGGPLIDIGTHALDLTLWMMNNYEPKVVLGTAYHKLSSKENAANSWGPWDPEKFKVEDSAFAMIVMKNGATIMVEASWALNTLDTKEAKCTLCGTEGGADMQDGLRINGENHSRLYMNQLQFEAKGADFYDGKKESMQDKEIRVWIDAVIHDKEPVVTPEQSCVVSEILEAIYESNRTGKAIYFD